jgi:hypothetical protein
VYDIFNFICLKDSASLGIFFLPFFHVLSEQTNNKEKQADKHICKETTKITKENSTGKTQTPEDGHVGRNM